VREEEKVQDALIHFRLAITRHRYLKLTGRSPTMNKYTEKAFMCRLRHDARRLFCGIEACYICYDMWTRLQLSESICYQTGYQSQALEDEDRSHKGSGFEPN
jgi:hypothetical protein